MEGRTFTTREAANIMGCSIRTIQRLIADGWLNGPPGGTIDDQVGRVTEKSLYQFMILDGLSRVPIRTLKALKNGRKHFERFSRQNANANCLINRGTCEPAASSPAPSNSERKHSPHYDFAEQY